MNTQEQTLIDGLFTRLKQAEAHPQPRDAQAQARIDEHLQRQPAAPYYMAQAILAQEAALECLEEQNQQLAAELEQARARQTAPNAGGGFLSSLFGRNHQASEPQRSMPRPSAGGWRDTPQGAEQAQPVRQQGFSVAPALGGASGFLGGAMRTAAGVAGGLLLAQGISSLFHYPSHAEDVVQVIREEPSPANDSAGWNDLGGFADTDYDSDGDFFADDFASDDDFV